MDAKYKGRNAHGGFEVDTRLDAMRYDLMPVDAM